MSIADTLKDFFARYPPETPMQQMQQMQRMQQPWPEANHTATQMQLLQAAANRELAQHMTYMSLYSQATPIQAMTSLHPPDTITLDTPERKINVMPGDTIKICFSSSLDAITLTVDVSPSRRAMLQQLHDQILVQLAEAACAEVEGTLP